MRKKAEQKLVPFFGLSNDPEGLEQLIKNLTPQNMGNIRNLVKTRKQELAEEIEEAKKLLTNPLTNPRQLQCLEDNANKLMQKVKSVEKVFDQMFLSRQEEKKQRIIINND